MRTSDLLKTLLANFANVIDNVKAVLISDADGLIVASRLGPGLDENVLGAMSTIVQPILDKLKKTFSFKSFGLATFDTNNFRLIFIDTGRKLIVIVVLEIIASIDATLPVAYLLAEKVATIAEDKAVQTEIPKIALYVDAVAEDNRLKDHIHQMRLKEGKYRFKFVIIGDASVGKTSLIMRFIEHTFSADYRSTIGLNVLAHTHNMLNNAEINFQIYDIGAQEFFRRVRSMYYTGAHACFILYDITRRETFDHVLTWYGELSEYVGTIPLCLIGNKADLESERVVSPQEALNLAENLEASFLETSAKTGQNVDDSFTLMGYKLLEAEQAREEEAVKIDIQEDIQAFFDQKRSLSLGILNEQMSWNPILDHFLHMPILGDIQQEIPEPGKRIVKFSTGAKIVSMNIEALARTPDMQFFHGATGVMCLFDGHKGMEITPRWREYLIELIKATQPACAIFVGIQCEEQSYQQFITELNLNPVLEQNAQHSVLFFNVSQDYNLELYDNIKQLLNSLPGME